MCALFAVGKTSNYVVLMANLVTRGKNEGIHAFIVQIRDENTHQPLKGSPSPRYDVHRDETSNKKNVATGVQSSLCFCHMVLSYD